jgi:phosphatidate cytidylyltransferase
LITRILAAVVGLALVLPTLIFGGVLGFQILISVIIVIGTDEYLRMMSPSNKKIWPIIHLIFLISGLGWMMAPEYNMTILALSSLVIWISSIFLSETNEIGLELSMRMTGGLIYFPFMMSQLFGLRDAENGLALIFFLLVITWCADSGAYFAGRLFGKNKLAPRLSPKKTWEGVFGGGLFAIVGALVMNHYFLQFPILHILLLAIILDAVSVIGDLFESMLKRSVNVKDSGWIMPGHGGALDRVDSLLFTGPMALAYLTISGLI